jgi:hypothetical protein
LSEGDDSDRKLRIEDEKSRYLYSGMPARILANSGLFEDMNPLQKVDGIMRIRGAKDSSD